MWFINDLEDRKIWSKNDPNFQKPKFWKKIEKLKTPNFDPNLKKNWKIEKPNFDPNLKKNMENWKTKFWPKFEKKYGKLTDSNRYLCSRKTQTAKMCQTFSK